MLIWDACTSFFIFVQFMPFPVATSFWVGPLWFLALQFKIWAYAYAHMECKFIFVQFMQFPVLHFGSAHSGSWPFNLRFGHVHMLIWNANSFLYNSCNFQYFILGRPTLVLGPSNNNYGRLSTPKLGTVNVQCSSIHTPNVVW